MFLDRLVQAAQRSMAERRRQVTEMELVRQVAHLPAPPSLEKGLARAAKPGLIAEVKKASPSRGLLASNFDPVQLAQIYAANGAKAISVLTEEEFFLGSPEYLQEIYQVVELPILRKDFIIDSYQVLEARSWGSAAVLLIVAILDEPQLRYLLEVAASLNLEALVEVHTLAEVEVALAAGAQLVGINNRDLTTFSTDLDTTLTIAKHLPPQITFVAESGLSTRADVEQVGRWGGSGVLVGEALVTAPDVAAKVRELAGGEATENLG